MKTLGALFIFLSSTYFGMAWAKKYRDRPRQLRQLKVALSSLEAEIVYGMTPLEQVSRRLAQQLPTPLALIFQHFASLLSDGELDAQEAWERSIELVWPKTALRSGEKEVLRQFGQTLGKHDVDQQQKQIKLALAHLERERNEADEAQKKNEKMVKSLGILTGLLVILILL